MEGDADDCVSLADIAIVITGFFWWILCVVRLGVVGGGLKCGVRVGEIFSAFICDIRRVMFVLLLFFGNLNVDVMVFMVVGVVVFCSIFISNPYIVMRIDFEDSLIQFKVYRLECRDCE